MGYQPGGEIMASLLPLVAHMQKYYINAKNMMNLMVFKLRARSSMVSMAP